MEYFLGFSYRKKMKPPDLADCINIMLDWELEYIIVCQKGSYNVLILNLTLWGGFFAVVVCKLSVLNTGLLLPQFYRLLEHIYEKCQISMENKSKVIYNWVEQWSCFGLIVLKT